MDDRINKEEKANKEEPLGQNKEEEDGEEESSTLGFKVDKGEEEEDFDFKWETPLEGLKTDWAPTASAHCKALKMLGTILASTTKSSSVEMRSLERVIRRIGGESQDIKTQLGNLQHLIQEHGSLADAVQAMLTADSFVQDNLTALREDIDTFSWPCHQLATKLSGNPGCSTEAKIGRWDTTAGSLGRGERVCGRGAGCSGTYFPRKVGPHKNNL